MINDLVEVKSSLEKPSVKEVYLCPPEFIPKDDDIDFKIPPESPPTPVKGNTY